MLAFLRRAALSRGILGGSKPWLVIGGVAWALRGAHLALRRDQEVVFLERLKVGERLLITQHPGPVPRRRRRDR